jgi:hypothetical protein
MRFGDPSWFFNRLMLWGAGLGFVTAAFLKEMQALGVFDGKTPDESIGWAGYVFLFGTILIAWFYVAKSARDNTAKAEAKEKYLEAQLRRAFAYHDAFASAIDGDMKSIARAEAISSDEVREATIDLELAQRIFYYASRAAEGEEN